MENEVFYNDKGGYLEFRLIGDQNKDTLEKLFHDAEPLIARMQREHKPMLGMMDLTGDGKYNAGSNRASMQLLEQVPYERLAMFGGSEILREVVELIILAIGKSENTQLFRDRASAEDWLRGNWPTL